MVGNMISVINKIKIILIVILIISSVLVILNYHIQTETIPPLKDKIEYNNEVLESTNSQFKKYQTDVNSIKKRVHDKNDELKLLQSSDIYYLHNPTYSEVIDFIEIDKTNEKEYNDNSFICSDFARIVNNNADKYGIRCGYTHITLSGYFDHVCVVFDIIDTQIITGSFGFSR